MPNHTEAKRIGVHRYETERLADSGSCLLNPAQFSDRRISPVFLFLKDDAGCRLFSSDGQRSGLSDTAGLEGFGWMGDAALRLRAAFPKPVYFSVVLQDAAQLAAEAGITPERPLGFRMKAECTQLEYERYPAGGYGEAAELTLAASGFLFFRPEHLPRDDESVRALCRLLEQYPAGGGICALTLAPLHAIEPAAPENTAAFIQPETLIRRVEMELFAPHRSCDAADFLIS